MIVRGGRSALPFVVATVLIDAIGFGIVMPVLPVIVMQLGHLGLADATRIGGWLAMLYAGVQFFTGPLIGNLGDRFGRRPVLLGALGGFAIDYALMGFAPHLWWLFVGRALAGLFGSCFGPAAAVIADISAPEDRARGYGMMGAAFGIGFVIGPAIGGLLGEIGPRAPFYAAAGFAALNFLFGLVAFPETFPRGLRRKFEWRRANPIGALLSLRNLPGILPLAFVSFWWTLASMIYPVAWSFYALAAFGWTPGMVGLSLAMVGALMAASQILLVGRVVRAIGERRAAMLGLSVATLQFLCYTVLHDGRAVFVVLLLIPFQSLVMPSLGALGSRRVPADRQGELQGFSGSVAAIAAIAAPALFNPALAYFTAPSAPVRFVGAPFVLAAAASLIALAGLALVARRDRQIPPATVS